MLLYCISFIWQPQTINFLDSPGQRALHMLLQSVGFVPLCRSMPKVTVALRRCAMA